MVSLPIQLDVGEKQFCLYRLASSHWDTPALHRPTRSFHSPLNRISFHAKLASTPMLEAATVQNNNKM